MEFILTEDDIAIADCLTFVDKNPNAIVMRDGCDVKTSYPDPEAPPPPMSSSISNMLNDEAPDNLLSSAALEKNVFSDDDEFGLQRLKKSNKNFERPTWEMELDTDELMEKDSDLGLELVNFPPPPPVSSPRAQMEPGPSVMNNDPPEEKNEDDVSLKMNGKTDEEETEILYEISTDSLTMKQDKLDVDDSFMDFQNEGHLNKEQYDDDVIILEALNDHNYTSCKISFDNVAQYMINDMTPAEESCLLDLLASRRRDNGASFSLSTEKREAVVDSDDDTVSNASTVCFPYTGDNQTIDTEDAAEAENGEAEEDENNDDDHAEVPGDTMSSRTICKEELVIVDEPDQNDVSEEMSEKVEEKSDDNTQSKNDVAGAEDIVQDDLPCESKTEVHESPVTVDTPQPQKNPQSSTEECSPSSALFSENRSEPNEFFDTEVHTSDSEVEDKNKPAESAEHAEDNSDQIDRLNLSAIDKSKLDELQTFANRLLGICKRPDPGMNLDKLMDELLVDFRSILGKAACTDMATQTEKIISKERRTRMNEKAKKRLLNASSSSDSCSSSEFDDDDMDDFPPNTPHLNINEANDEAVEENAADEDKLEKSPSYSDLSVAGSEEFLNSEADENDIRSVSDGIDLSRYVVPSPGKSNVTESEDLDLSKYEVRNENVIEQSPQADDTTSSATASQAEVSSEYVPVSEDTVTASEVTNKEAEESNVDKETIGDDVQGSRPTTPPMVAVDEEMPEISATTDKLDEAETSDKEDSDTAINDGGKSVEDIIESDDKLKAEVVVNVKKLSDEDLEDYYDNLRDIEIRKLLKFSGIKKLRLVDSVPSPSDKPQPVYKSKATKKLLEVLKEVENDMCSDDSNSDAEETQLTEKQFLKMCNEKAKEDILKSASSDSELESKESDVEELNAVSDSSDDEEGPSMVDKFLEKFATNIDDDDDDADVEDADVDDADAGDADVEDADAVDADVEDMDAEVTDVNIDKKVEDQKPDVEVEADSKKDATVKVEETKQIENENQTATAAESTGSDVIHKPIDDPSSDELSDDVVVVSADTPKKPVDDSKEKSDSETRSTATTPKPSTSRGLPRSLRNILVDEKEIDIDAIERSTPTMINDVDEDVDDIFDKAIRRPASNKSLETLIEESRRRHNIRSTDNNTVILDSDSDLEEVTVEPELPKRTIKPMLRKDQLAGETRTAQRRESERIKRLERKNETLANAISDSSSTEKELILDYNSETKQFIKVHPEIVKHLKEHQFEGIKFMYDNTYGSVDHLKRNPGSGCILAHCMGLGKTLQIVALLHTVINHKEMDTCRILVLCPKSTVMNWADEVKRWLGPIKIGLPKIYSFYDNVSNSIEDKLKILHEWSQCGKPGFRKSGLLLLGYEAFRTLVLSPLHKKKQISPAALDKIKQKISDALLDPGADLVICDEGHIIKNRKSATSMAVSQIRTPRRIVLTGTPIQNNLKEYYAMVNFIKPKFLGTEKEFANLYENPIRNGQHKDSSKHDIKIMKQRSFVLHKKLSKFVQRREAALLEKFLPAKFEYVLFVPMTEVQISLYEYFLQESSKRESSRGKNLIPDYTCLRKIWTHPRVLENAWKNAIQKKREHKKSPLREPNSDDEQPDDVYDTQTGALSVTDDWWRSLLSEDNLKSILPSSKLQVMFEILRMCAENGEKCLIFSAFVAVLDCVEYFMNEITKQSENAREYGLLKYRGPWESGKDYYRLDGKTPKNIRHQMIKSFNDPHYERARVFLISAKAGGQGINLIGANRVIILDTSWNPSNDQQNIFRVFRLGQKRQCYVYRLLAMGTMEEKVYSRAVTKQAMSFRVVDEQQIDRHYSMAELAELYTLTKPDYDNRPVPALPQDGILASLLRNSPHLVYKYHEHDSLLENRSEQELSEQEKNDAWEAYERDLQGSQNPEFLAAGLNNMQHLYQNSGFPPGMGYGFPQDRNFPMGYAGGLPQGYYPPSAYTGNPSFIDMLKMFTGPPPHNPTMMSVLNSNAGGNTQNNMHPYGAGAIPSTSSAPPQNSMPMNLPPFSSLQNMTSSTGVNSIPSFTSPYSSMANSYNLTNDSALLRLSQMYASSLGVAGGSAGMPPPDSRSPPGRPATNSPTASGGADIRNPPFSTGIQPPTSSADGIPTSVIKPTQVYGSSSGRTPMPPAQSLAHQLSQMPIRPPPPAPFAKAGTSSHISLQQQLMAQPRLPPPHVPLQGLQPLMPQSIATSRALSDAPHHRPPTETTVTKSAAFTTSVVNATSPVISSVTSAAINRNSSPVTASSRHNSPVIATSRHNSPVTATSRHNSPQSKASFPNNSPRATNMGIVYPPENNSTTIIPVPSPGGGSSSSGISVRSVSSINSASSKNSIPATIIPKPGAVIPPHLTNTVKKTNAVPNMPASGMATSNPTISVSPINSKQPNVATRPGNSIEKTQKSVNSSSLLSQLRSPLQPPPEKKDKSKGVVGHGPVNKTAIQILGSNNVQLTKVPNSRSVLAQSQNNLGNKPRAYPSPILKNPSGLHQQLSGSGVITKARSNTELTVVPVTSNAVDSAAKTTTTNNSATVVPTLVPFSTKAMTITPANRPTVVTNARSSLATTTANSTNLGALTARPANSTLASIKRTVNATRVYTPSAKSISIDPQSVSSGSSLIKRTLSFPNLPGAKQPRSLTNNTQTSRQSTSSVLSNQQLGRQQSQPPASNTKSSPSPNNSNKNLVSIRNMDTINRFTNAGITISSGKGRLNATTANQNVLINQGNSSIKNANSSTTPNVNNLSSGVVLSKVGMTARKRPLPNLVSDHLAPVDPLKRPRIAQPVVDRSVAESISRARTNQGLTISVKNPQGNQRTKKDGKVTEVVEID